MPRRHHRLVATLACCAMFMAALAPVVSRLLAAIDPVVWAEICRVQRAPGKAGTPDPLASLHLEHCPYCANHAAGPGLPPPAGFLLAPVAQCSEAPPLFLAAPRPLFAWTAAQPRGPPPSLS